MYDIYLLHVGEGPSWWSIIVRGKDGYLQRIQIHSFSKN